MSKKVWLAIFIIAGLLYAYHEGYLSDILKQPSLEKAVSHVQSKLEQTVSKRTSPSNPKEAYLKSYPVKVWYDVKPKVLKYWWGGKENVTAVSVYFKNEGSKRVSFVVDPSSIRIIDEKGDNEYIGRVVNSEVVLHPGEVKAVELYFNEVPHSGWLYMRLVYADIKIVHYGGNLTGIGIGSPKSSENVRLYFEAK